MNQYVEPQVKKPNTSLSIKAYHFTALKLLDDMYEEHRARLRKINKPESDAWVQREDWKTRLKYELRCQYEFCSAIEESLLKDDAICFAGSNSYVERVVKQEKTTMPTNYFCSKCKTYKAVPVQHYQPGDRVNFTLAGYKGQPASNQVGKVLAMQHNIVVLQYNGRSFNRSREDVTPLGAPHPIQYSLQGKCWCAVEEGGQ